MNERSQTTAVTALLFGAGAIVAVVVYAIASVYLFEIYEPRWGRGFSFQVVLMVGIAVVVVSAVAFGLAFGLSTRGADKIAVRNRRRIAFSLGILVVAAGACLAVLIQKWLGTSPIWVASSFIVCSIIAALVLDRVARQNRNAAG